uniref:Putative ovule protein n=1 Tax=Solanum chacoense TaxID=4108 RepID=A0A0V0GSM6_SOLCH
MFLWLGGIRVIFCCIVWQISLVSKYYHESWLQSESSRTRRFLMKIERFPYIESNAFNYQRSK